MRSNWNDRLRLFVWNVFPKFGHVIAANKRIERFATQANAFQSRQFFGGNTKLLAQLALGRFVSEIVAKLGRDAPHLGNFIDHLSG